jgi:uncharacterized RDD family membrane protein YckC
MTENGKPSADHDDAFAPASLLRRLAALVYDALLLAALVFLFTLAVVLARGGREIAPGTIWFELCLVALAFAFCGLFWTRGGQTLGMHAWGIRLVAADGRRVGWERAAVRFFAAWLSMVPAGLGYWWMLVDRDRLSWHDRLSGTRMVRVTKARFSAPAREPRA